MKCIFFTENVCIFVEIPLLKDPMCNKSAMVEVMAGCQTDTKPLPESMLTQIYHAIYVSRPDDLTSDYWFDIHYQLYNFL